MVVKDKIKSPNKKQNEKRYKKNEESDSSDDDVSTKSESESENEDVDMHKIRKMIAKQFPSKYYSKKVKKEEKKLSKKNKKNKKVKEESSSSESESDQEEYEDNFSLKNNKNLNIIFTIGGNPNEEEWEEEDSEEYDPDDDSEYLETEDESGDEEESEDEEESDEELESEEELQPIDEKNISREKHSEKQSDEELLTQCRENLKGMVKQNKNKILQEYLDSIEEDLKIIKKKKNKVTNKERVKNTNMFKKTLNQKNLFNDFKYFKEKLDVDHQKKIINQVKQVNKVNLVQKPYRISLLESDIKPELKAIALNKLSNLRYMEPGNGEYYKVKNWVDTFMKLPFNIYKNLPITKDDGLEKCNEYMENCEQTLNSAVYGLNDAKIQIMQLVAQWISNPKAIGNAIAIKGPMGTGKTTLIKEGISKILNREFAFIALGGATDSSFLEGHSYTYEGSTWGKVVDILIRSKSMNPVIYFDELDKISDTPKGEEIAGILTHLTDTSQNTEFHDKYFSEIDFDLSKCLFIFSYNDESKVNPILLDRMYKIQTKGYEKKDKRVIANQYLIPKIIEQVKFDEKDVIISDEILDYIVDEYTKKENGVRNLKRCLEIIYTKINLFKLMGPNKKLFDQETPISDLSFPLTLTKQHINKIINRDDDDVSEYIRKTMYL